MDIKQMKLADLIPYQRNAKKHDKKQIDNVAESLRLYGFVQPVVVDADNNIVIGHCRCLAAKKLGLEEVPVVKREDLTPEEANKLRLLDNKLNESDWDFSLLAEDLETLDFSDFDIDWGIPESALAKDVIEDDVPEIDEDAEPIARRGDIYQLGNHRLMCGDSTSADDVKKLVDGSLVDLLLTDPPYNVDYEGGTGMKIMNDSMDNDSFRKFLKDAFSAANEVMKPGAVFYIWHADSEGYNFRGACMDVGWKVRECLIWNKNSLVMGRQDYHWKHEPCLYGWKDGTHLWASDRKQTTVIDMDRPAKADIHPTMKPVGLFAYQLMNNTKPCDIVLDLFNGSGTTIMACEQTGRYARCMELDPRYVDAAVERWEKFTGQKAIKISGEDTPPTE